MDWLFDGVATAEDNDDYEDELMQNAVIELGKRRAELMTPEEIIAELGKNCFK